MERELERVFLGIFVKGHLIKTLLSHARNIAEELSR